MANEIHIDYTSGNTLYAVIRNEAGEVWHAGGQVFEAWGTGGRTADDYDISLTDKGGSRYVGDFDGNIPSGRYTVQAFVQGGADPVDGDNLAGGDEIVWSGAGVITCDKLLANKAVQDKVSGEITYYDDDGQTVILTHTPADAAAAITRTPS
jgi:predicted GNAT family acetyltransferase